ncbi:nitroreductase [bacterium]|nr:nitroreductase [bacterium]
MAEFNQSVINLIKQRSSWRAYRSGPLEPEVLDALEKHLAEERPGPFNCEARFHLITRQVGDTGKARKIGTYGTITGAGNYIVGVIKPAEKALENFGYLMEETILYATALDLGTCWLGGFLHRDDLAKEISPGPDEYIPAMTPVGRIAEKRGIQDHILRWSARSKNRKPWEELFFAGQFSKLLKKNEAGAYAEALEMVRLAPSASNRQPWRILQEEKKPFCHFYLRRNALYRQIAKSVLQAEDIQRLDMGIAMCHFEKTARELNLKGAWIQAAPAIALPSKMEYCVSWRGR